MMLSAFIVLAVIAIVLAFLNSKREKRIHHNHADLKLTAVPLISAATTLGIGLGGFIDGTVLHQILQWHEMLSNKIPPVTLLNKSVNMFWDGIFHFFCLLVTITGMFLLTRLFFRKDVIVTWKNFFGGLLLGWGLFNVVEGVIDHQILKLHNVREVTDNIPMWNYGFLALSVIFIIVSMILIKSGTPDRLYVPEGTTLGDEPL
jgi:uncharacterized membrane protein